MLSRIPPGWFPPAPVSGQPPLDQLPEPFDWYPYLVQRIGHSSLRHMAVLPARWPRVRLTHLARRQAAINHLETCLCLGPAEALYISPEGEATESSLNPTGAPVAERLVLAGRIWDTVDVHGRRLALAAYARELTQGLGCLVGDGLEGGRPATPEELEFFGRVTVDGTPNGLSHCGRCGCLAGEYLALRGEGNGDLAPRILRVHCRCENHHRCAGCGQGLHDRRLSAYYYDEEQRTVMYVAAYAAFSHRCP